MAKRIWYFQVEYKEQWYTLFKSEENDPWFWILFKVQYPVFNTRKIQRGQTWHDATAPDENSFRIDN